MATEEKTECADIEEEKIEDIEMDVLDSMMNSVIIKEHNKYDEYETLLKIRAKLKNVLYFERDKYDAVSQQNIRNECRTLLLDHIKIYNALLAAWANNGVPKSDVEKMPEYELNNTTNNIINYDLQFTNHDFFQEVLLLIDSVLYVVDNRGSLYNIVI